MSKRVKKNTSKQKIKQIKKISKVTGISVLSLLISNAPLAVVNAVEGSVQSTNTGTVGGTLSGGNTNIAHHVWETGKAQLHFVADKQVVQISNLYHHGEWYFNGVTPNQHMTTTVGNSIVNTQTAITIGNNTLAEKQNSGQGNAYFESHDSRNPAVHNTGGAELSCGDLAKVNPGTHVYLRSVFHFIPGAGATATGGVETLNSDLGTVKDMPCNFASATSQNSGTWNAQYKGVANYHSLTAKELQNYLDAIKEFSLMDPEYAKYTASDIAKLENELKENPSTLSKPLQDLKSVLEKHGFSQTSNSSKFNPTSTSSTTSVVTYDSKGLDALTNDQKTAISNYLNAKELKDSTQIANAQTALSKLGLDESKITTSTSTSTQSSSSSTATSQITNTALSNSLNLIKQILANGKTGNGAGTGVATTTDITKNVNTSNSFGTGTTRVQQVHVNFVTTSTSHSLTPTFIHHNKETGVCVLCNTRESIVNSIAKQNGKEIKSEKMLNKEGGVLLHIPNVKIQSTDDVIKHQDAIQEEISKLTQDNIYERQIILNKDNDLVKTYYLVGFDKEGNQLWVESKDSWNNRLNENEKYTNRILGSSKTITHTIVKIAQESQDKLNDLKTAGDVVKNLLDKANSLGLNPSGTTGSNTNPSGTTQTPTGTTNPTSTTGVAQTTGSVGTANPTGISTGTNPTSTTGNTQSLNDRVNQLINNLNSNNNKENLLNLLKELKTEFPKLTPALENDKNIENDLNKVITLLSSKSLSPNDVNQVKNITKEIFTNLYSWSTQIKTNIGLYVVEAEKIQSSVTSSLNKDYTKEDSNHGSIHYATISKPKTMGDHTKEFTNVVKSNINANIAKFNNEYKDLSARVKSSQIKNEVIDFLKAGWEEYHQIPTELDRVLNAMKQGQTSDLDKLLSGKPELLAMAKSILGSVHHETKNGEETSKVTSTNKDINVQTTPTVTKMQASYFGDDEELSKHETDINKAIAELERQNKLIGFEGFKSTSDAEGSGKTTFSASGTVTFNCGHNNVVGTTHINQGVQHFGEEKTADYELNSHTSDDINKLNIDWKNLESELIKLSTGNNTKTITKTVEGVGTYSFELNDKGGIDVSLVSSQVQPKEVIRIIGNTTGSNENPSGTTQTPTGSNANPSGTTQTPTGTSGTTGSNTNPSGTTQTPTGTSGTTTGNAGTATQPTTETLNIFKLANPKVTEMSKRYVEYKGAIYQVNANNEIDLSHPVTNVDKSSLVEINHYNLNSINLDTKTPVINDVVTESSFVGEKSESTFETNGNLSGTVENITNNHNKGISATYELSDDNFNLKEQPESISIIASAEENPLMNIQRILGKSLNQLWYDDLTKNQKLVSAINKLLGTEEVEKLLANRTHIENSDQEQINKLLDALKIKSISSSAEKLTLSKDVLTKLKVSSKSVSEFESKVKHLIDNHKFSLKEGYITIIGKYDDNCLKHIFVDSKHVSANETINVVTNVVRGVIKCIEQIFALFGFIIIGIASLIYKNRDK